MIPEETRDVLTKALQRRCPCGRVFETKVVSVHHCPKCRGGRKDVA